MARIWIDGQWTDRAGARVSVFDHGLLYGDGVFEGMRAYGGRVFRNDEHLDRLWDSAKAIGLTIPYTKQDLTAVIAEGVRESGLDDAHIRPIVTRSEGGLGIDPRSCKQATVIIIIDKIRVWPEERYETGLRVVSAATPVPHREALSPRVKSLNYLPHVLAKMEGTNAGADEVLMLDASGFVAEASGMNLFVVRHGLIRTPASHAGILRGVTRDAVLELAVEAGYRVEEDVLNRYDVYTADEAFFTGTAAEVAPIREVDGRAIGDGTPGPVTRDLRARFLRLVRG